MNKVFYNEARLTKILNEMKIKGIKIDKKYVNEGMQYEIGKIRGYKEDFEKVTGRAFADSPKLFKEVFTGLNVPYPKTAKGNPSFKADVLKKMKNPVADIINNIRYHDKRVNSFYTTFLYKAGNSDIIHANLNSGATATGRFSSSAPNMQNLSKEDKENDAGKPYYIRGCFVPREGNVFSAIDYKQVEYRILMDFAGETEVINAIMDGEDVHDTVARMIGFPRKEAKNISFGILYGMGVDALANVLGVSYNESVEVRKLYFSRLPKVEKLIGDIKYVAKNRGYLKNRFGRVYKFHRGEEYKAPNYLIQGTAADTIKFALTKIYEENELDYFPVSTLIHDEIVSEFEEDHLEYAFKIGKAMESIYQPFVKNLVLEVDLEKSDKSLSVWDMESHDRKEIRGESHEEDREDTKFPLVSKGGTQEHQGLA